MTAPDVKSELRDYLQGCRDAMLWKLGGLSEYDAARPEGGGRSGPPDKDKGVVG